MLFTLPVWIATCSEQDNVTSGGWSNMHVGSHYMIRKLDALYCWLYAYCEKSKHCSLSCAAMLGYPRHEICKA